MTEESTHKNFFTTLPGIITAIAGLITALGGFLLVLNKTGCIGSNKVAEDEQTTVQTEQQKTVAETEKNNLRRDSTFSDGNITYSPAIIKNRTRYVEYRIEEATVETLPGGEIVFNLKMKCVNESNYEYHFYSNYIRIKIGDDSYAADAYSPSGDYQSVNGNGFKNLEYNFYLPVGSKSFQLLFYDERTAIGSATFTLR